METKALIRNVAIFLVECPPSGLICLESFFMVSFIFPTVPVSCIMCILESKSKCLIFHVVLFEVISGLPLLVLQGHWIRMTKYLYLH